jgi:hypothetical protein
MMALLAALSHPHPELRELAAKGDFRREGEHGGSCLQPGHQERRPDERPVPVMLNQALPSSPHLGQPLLLRADEFTIGPRSRGR